MIARAQFRLVCCLCSSALLLAMFAPLLAMMNEASRVPLCCRRNGAHHCQGMMPSDSGPAVSAVSHCPLWPCCIALAQNPQLGAAGSADYSARLVSIGRMMPATKAAANQARERQLALRGPPVLFLA